MADKLRPPACPEQAVDPELCRRAECVEERDVRPTSVTPSAFSALMLLPLLKEPGSLHSRVNRFHPHLNPPPSIGGGRIRKWDYN